MDKLIISFFIVVSILSNSLNTLTQPRVIEIVKAEIVAQNKIEIPVVEWVEMSSSSIKKFIEEKAIEYNVPIERALFIARKESNFNPDVIGDGDKICQRTGKPIRSRGLWQINDCVWTDVSDEVAFNIVSSTLWAMPKLNETPEIWSTHRFCKLWYEDCYYE